MKIAITGHTAGIGKRFVERYPGTIGFSRTNGYDINNYDDRMRIITESTDCDVFINNASSGFGQSDLLIEMFKQWHSTPKIIVNVGSRIAEENVLLNGYNHLLIYQSHKVLLKEMSNRISRMKSVCKVKYTWFGYVGTAAILEKYPHFTEKDYITEDQSVDIITKEFL